MNTAEQQSVADYMEKEQVTPSLVQAQELKGKSQEAAKATKVVQATGPIHSHYYEPSLPSSLKAGPSTPAPQPAEKKPPAPVTDKTIASIMKHKKEPDLKITLTWDELRGYFGKQPTIPEAKRTIFDAMDMRKKVLAKQGIKQGNTTPVR